MTCANQRELRSEQRVNTWPAVRNSFGSDIHFLFTLLTTRGRASAAGEHVFTVRAQRAYRHGGFDDPPASNVGYGTVTVLPKGPTHEIICSRKDPSRLLCPPGVRTRTPRSTPHYPRPNRDPCSVAISAGPRPRPRLRPRPRPRRMSQLRPRPRPRRPRTPSPPQRLSRPPQRRPSRRSSRQPPRPPSPVLAESRAAPGARAWQSARAAPPRPRSRRSEPSSPSG